MSTNNISTQTKNDSKDYVTELTDSELNGIQGGESREQQQMRAFQQMLEQLMRVLNK
jgi:bacteriocin-like protein